MSKVPLTPGYPEEDPSKAKTAFICAECSHILFLDIHLLNCDSSTNDHDHDSTSVDIEEKPIEGANISSSKIKSPSKKQESSDTETDDIDAEEDEDEFEDEDDDDESDVKPKVKPSLSHSKKSVPKKIAAPTKNIPKKSLKVEDYDDEFEDDDDWDDDDEDDEDDEDDGDEIENSDDDDHDDDDDGGDDDDGDDEDEDDFDDFDDENKVRGALRKARKEEREAMKAEGYKVRGMASKSKNWKRNEFLKMIDNKRKHGIQIKCQYYYTTRKMKWMEQQSVDTESKGRILCPNSSCKAKLGRFEWSGIPCDCGEWKAPGFQFMKQRVMQRQIGQ